MSTNTQFVAPSGEVNADDRLQHVAIQATAGMLQGWFEGKTLKWKMPARW